MDERATLGLVALAWLARPSLELSDWCHVRGRLAISWYSLSPLCCLSFLSIGTTSLYRSITQTRLASI